MIGDVLTSSILFEAIKLKYPDAELHYVINSHTYPVVEHNPFVDQFHFFTPQHEKSKRQLYIFAKQLKKEKFDIVVDVYSKLSSNIISYISAAQTKISKYKWYTSFIYTHLIEEKDVSNTNAGLAIENRLLHLEPLGVNTSEIIKPKIYLTDTEKVEAKRFLETNGIEISKPLYMIGVLGSGSAKTYPFEFMAHIIDRIIEQQPKGQVLFNYIPNQIDDAKAIFNLCNEQTQQQIHFDVFGKSLRDFLAITSFCDALIGNEGGAINMAKAIDIPTFTIFSPWIQKEVWNIFDDGIRHVSVHLKDYDEAHYRSIKKFKALKSKSHALYTKFKPSYFETDLIDFLKRLNNSTSS